MSNETGREGFEEWFNSTELPDCLTARDGKSSVTVNVESICRTAWQARDAEVNELRKEVAASERQVEILTTTCSEFNDENDRLRKEVERLNKKISDAERRSATTIHQLTR